MKATLEQLRSLEEIYQNGLEDEYLSRAMDKITSYEICRCQRDLDLLRNDLEVFEKKYNMDSETFGDRWGKGMLADEADFFEWSALYQMYRRSKKRLEILTGEANTTT